MAQSEGSAGASAPARPKSKKSRTTGQGKGRPAGTAQPAPAPEPADKPSVKIPMAWVASGAQVGGTWWFEGADVEWPQVGKLLKEIGGEGDNVVVVPRPADLVEGICSQFPRNHKVSGRLPALVLYPRGEGNNQAILAEYYAAHPPYAAEVRKPSDWGKIHHPKKK